MQAALIEFLTESMALYGREFYASRMGTIIYFSKEALANGLTYSECFLRDKRDRWEEQAFPFNCTPAVPVEGAVRVEEVIYRAGDDPGSDQKDRRLLRFGTQEVISPGSVFRAMLWGNLPELSLGQVFWIGKKRGTAVITALELREEAEITGQPRGLILPIQIAVPQASKFPAYEPLVLMHRFLIIRLPAMATRKWLNVAGYSTPFLDQEDSP